MQNTEYTVNHFKLLVPSLCLVGEVHFPLWCLCSISRPVDLQCKSPWAAHIFHVRNLSKNAGRGSEREMATADEGGRIQPAAWRQPWMNLKQHTLRFQCVWGHARLWRGHGRNVTMETTEPPPIIKIWSWAHLTRYKTELSCAKNTLEIWDTPNHK